jgi:hypothetical protein
MNAEDFVEALRTHVMEAAVADTISILQRPPGRSPSPELVELSNWLKGIPQDDAQKVERVLALCARQVLFGVFAVIDGSRAIDPRAGVGDHFELRHVHAEGVEILAGPAGAVLHDLL